MSKNDITHLVGKYVQVYLFPVMGIELGVKGELEKDNDSYSVHLDTGVATFQQQNVLTIGGRNIYIAPTREGLYYGIDAQRDNAG